MRADLLVFLIVFLIVVGFLSWCLCAVGGSADYAEEAWSKRGKEDDT